MAKQGILKVKVGDILEKFFPKTYASLVFLKDGRTTAEEKIEEIDAKDADDIRMINTSSSDIDKQWSNYSVQGGIQLTFDKAKHNEDTISKIKSGSITVGSADKTDGLHFVVKPRGTNINSVSASNTIVFIEK